MSSARLLASLASAVRTAWLVLGMVLLLGLVLEGSCRVREAVERRRDPGNPLARQPWWPQWARTHASVNGPSRYDPYRGWWATPYNSPYVNRDLAGRHQRRHRPGDRT